MKICECCGAPFERPSKYSQKQWDAARCCSVSCAARARAAPELEPVLDRVARYVKPTAGCHVWTGSLGSNDRPQMTTGSKLDGTHRVQRVHRVVWEAHHGPCPPGMDVHHACGNITCVNVEHLELFAHGEHSQHHASLNPDFNPEFGQHVRWHVSRGVVNPACAYC